MRMMKTTMTRLIMFGFLFVSLPSQAVEYQSPRTLALGGAGRAGPLLNDSIYLNPAYASFNSIYSANLGYTWFEHGRNYNVSVQDTRNEFLQAGVGYTKRERNSAINLGASRQVVKQVGFGLGSKFIIDNTTNKITNDMSFATTYIAQQWVYVSLVVDNLIQGQESKQRNLFRTVYLAFKFIPTKDVEFFFDPLYSPDYQAGNKSGFSLGVELGLLADFYFRAGKFKDAEITHLDSRGDGYGVGLGWIGPRINFDYAFSRVTTSHAGLASTVHSLSTTLFF